MTHDGEEMFGQVQREQVGWYDSEARAFGEQCLFGMEYENLTERSAKWLPMFIERLDSVVRDD